MRDLALSLLTVQLGACSLVALWQARSLVPSQRALLTAVAFVLAFCAAAVSFA